MANYNYLKIDIYGQFNNDTVHKFTYPEPYNPLQRAAMAWLNPIKDHRNDMRSFFPSADYCYKIHRDNNGVYYSLIMRNAEDVRGGYIMITVMCPNTHIKMINGKSVFELLNLLKIRVVEAKNFNAPTVENCLAASGMTQQQQVAPPFAALPATATAQIAYRVYSSPQELFDLFQFPKQDDYNKFADVFFVKQIWAQAVPQTITRLTAPIRRIYNIVKPASVQAQNEAVTNTQMIITYTKQGYAPLKIPVTINGVNSQYVRYEGNTITILEPANLPFKKDLNLVVRINGKLYNDNKVKAAIGNAPLTIKGGAYSTELSPDKLADAVVKLTVDVNDDSLRPTTRTIYQREEQNTLYKWLWPIVALIAGVAIGAGGVYFLSSDEAEIPEAVQSPVNNELQAQFEQQDLDYMKKHNVWVQKEIQSEKYKGLYNAISRAQLNDFKSKAQDYLSNEPSRYNGYIKKIIDSYKYVEVEKAKDIFTKNSKDGKIYLENIDNELRQAQGGAPARADAPAVSPRSPQPQQQGPRQQQTRPTDPRSPQQPRTDGQPPRQPRANNKPVQTPTPGTQAKGSRGGGVNGAATTTGNNNKTQNIKDEHTSKTKRKQVDL